MIKRLHACKEMKRGCKKKKRDKKRMCELSSAVVLLHFQAEFQSTAALTEFL